MKVNELYKIGKNNFMFFIGVHIFSHSLILCRYVREGSDRTKGHDIIKFLSIELDANEDRIRKLLHRHPYWCHIPLTTVRDTLHFLLDRGFTKHHILFNIHAVLYTRSVMQACMHRYCLAEACSNFLGPLVMFIHSYRADDK
jgi:hypothetical protein